MKNILYFAVCGNDTPLPVQDGAFAYGGFGFLPDGSIRQSYPLPPDAVVLLDDRTLPRSFRPELLHDFISENRIETVIFDFEQPKTEILCQLVQSVKEVQTVVPPSYAALCRSAVLLPPYHPREPFTHYLKRWQQRHQRLVLDCSPVGAMLTGGKWQQVRVQNSGGCLTQKQQCMYCTQRKQNGTTLQFYDTKKTLLNRAFASKLPCIVPLEEYLSLPEE